DGRRGGVPSHCRRGREARRQRRQMGRGPAQPGEHGVGRVGGTARRGFLRSGRETLQIRFIEVPIWVLSISAVYPLASCRSSFVPFSHQKSFFSLEEERRQ